MIPEIRILLYICFAVSLFSAENWWLYASSAAVLGALCALLPFSKLRAGWLPITIFLAFTFLSNALNGHGRIVYAAGPVHVTAEGVDLALIRTVRIVLMIAGAKVLMGLSRPEEIVKGLGNLLAPLERLRIPVEDFFHTMALTMKCFPVLKDMAAERYRTDAAVAAADGFPARARAVSQFLLPFFVESIRSPEIFFEHPGKHDAD